MKYQLEIITKSLETNNDVVLVNKNETGFNLYPITRAKLTEYFLAPSIGLYTPQELQQFLEGLTPEGLKPSRIMPFFQSLDKLVTGRLHFNDVYDNVILRLFPDKEIAEDICNNRKSLYEISLKDLNKKNRVLSKR